uniref:Uncharacterized protein n=1 Tax=Anguilla anguilla TaxID=7936 RepID=A0A0E9XMD5_ANGAN
MLGWFINLHCLWKEKFVTEFIFLLFVTSLPSSPLFYI